MSQQGERPTGQQDDWWGQLYDDSTGDTGPAPASDSLDDRFASATDTLGTPTDPPAADPAERPTEPPTPPATGRSIPPQRPAPAPEPREAHGEAPRTGPPFEPREGRGELRGRPSRPAPDARPAGTPTDDGSAEKMPPPWWPPSGPAAAAPWAPHGPWTTDPRGAGTGGPGTGGPVTDNPGPARGEPRPDERPEPDARSDPQSDPLWRSGLRRQRAPWEAPPEDPPGPTTFQQGQGPTAYRTPPPTAMSTEVPGSPAPTSRPPSDQPSDQPSNQPSDRPSGRPSEWPQPPGGPPTIGPPPTVGTPSVGDTARREPATGHRPADGAEAEAPAAEEAAESPANPRHATLLDVPTGTPAASDQPVLQVPDTPTPLDHVGSGPPTYDPEPTALPPADPDDLDDLVADTVLDGASYGTYTLRAVSVRGDSARFRGEPRRDSLLTARFGTGDGALVLVAMATGARATPDAHRAAAEACHWIGRAVGRSHARLAEDIRAARRGDLKSGLHRLTDRSLGKLRAGAVERGVEPEEYTASLRCLLLPADPECRTRVFFGVGAGGLFRLRDGEWQDIEPRVADTAGEAVVGFGSLPHETPEGDRLTMDLGITTPPSPYEPAPEPPPRDPFRFRASVARPGDTLLLCSGGLAEPLRGEPRLVEHLTARWSRAEPPGVAAFLADSTVRVKGYADDRTAAAVWEA
ncbi:protein phosphatase 2C domain-containing protein [Streptomyces sp. NBC_00414]|uniref:protein phosphatase 2C domain-containing protein n=1 Tax=Streptomyces sp. NBC_00414 TaxID=2975739 RepID=UPI002E1D3310